MGRGEAGAWGAACSAQPSLADFRIMGAIPLVLETEEAIGVPKANEYITRRELVEVLGKIKRALDRDVEPALVSKVAGLALRRADVPWRDGHLGVERQRRLTDLLNYLVDHDGATFREVAEELGISPKGAESLARATGAIELAKREDLKGMYGNKPWGMYLTGE